MATELAAFEARHAALVASWATSADELDRWAGRNDHPLDPRVVESWHADPDVHPWLLLTEGEPVAYGEIWLDPEADDAELARVIVDPRRRGRGFGRLLVRGLSERAAAELEEVWVRVVSENAPAIACYAGAGFVRTSPQREDVFNSGQPRRYVWMRLHGIPDAG